MSKALLLLMGILVLGQHCRAEEPSITLQGLLLEGEFYGPPNYGEDPAKDSVERAYFLQLPAAIGVQNPRLAREETRTEIMTTVYFVQLVVPNSKMPETAGLVGHRVQVEGTLLSAITGHHRTDTVLEASSKQELDSWSW